MNGIPLPTPFRLPRFYPILDTEVLSGRGCPVPMAAEALIDAGVRILQYRHKQDWTQAHFDEAKQLAALCDEAGVLFVLNDRADFARLLKSALHVGQDDLSPAAARRLISDEVMGFSTHNRDQLARGNEEAVEYLSIGPIFQTGSKRKPDPVVGLERLQELRDITEKPLAAIGGITLENAPQVFAAKADSVAVISGIVPHTCTRKAWKSHAEEWLRVCLQSG
ncbi:MAG TPA: thiamine phosphate synthase [Bryobacteraceae bacterium]